MTAEMHKYRPLNVGVQTAEYESKDRGCGSIDHRMWKYRPLDVQFLPGVAAGRIRNILEGKKFNRRYQEMQLIPEKNPHFLFEPPL